MNNERISHADGLDRSLQAGCIFALIHILTCLLMNSMAPEGSPWNILFLAVEVCAAGAAVLFFLISFLRAEKADSPEKARFLALFRSMRFGAFYCLIAWCVWSVAACLFAVSEGLASLSHNVRYLFYLASSLLILFPLGFALGRENRPKLLWLLYDLCLACFAVFLVCGFWRFFRGDTHFDMFFGREFDFTIPRPRFGQNQNSTGAYCAFFLIMGLYRFAEQRTVLRRLIQLLLLVPVAAAFSLVESRAAVIAGACAFGVFMLALIYRRCRGSRLMSTLLALAALAAAAALFVLLFYRCRDLTSSMQKLLLPSQEAVSNGVGETRELVGENASNLAGRLRVWKAVIASICQDRHLLIHGCSQASTTATVFKLIGKNYNTHNQFLEILLSQGLPAMLLYCVWLVWTAVKSIDVGLGGPGERDHTWMLPLPLLFLVVDNLSETMLAGRGHFVGGFFFLLAGFVGGLSVSRKSQDGQ